MKASELITKMSVNGDRLLARECFILFGDDLYQIKEVYLDDHPFRIDEVSEQRPWFIVAGTAAQFIKHNAGLEAFVDEVKKVFPGVAPKEKGNQ